MVVALWPRSDEEGAKWVALVTTLVVVGFMIYVLANFDYDRSGALQFAVNREWIRSSTPGTTSASRASACRSSRSRARSCR